MRANIEVSMQFRLILILGTLILTGCHQHKASQAEGNDLKKLIVGTWIYGDKDFEWNIASDGSFNSFSGGTNVDLFYEGTWQASNDVLYCTITNVIGPRKHEANGRTDKMKIIKLDATNLTIEMLGTTLSYKRR